MCVCVCVMQSDNSSTCLVADFVHSIAAQMCQAPQLAAFRQVVQADPALQSLLSLAECVANPHAAFVNGILEPLSALKPGGHQVIDLTGAISRSARTLMEV